MSPDPVTISGATLIQQTILSGGVFSPSTSFGGGIVDIGVGGAGGSNSTYLQIAITAEILAGAPLVTLASSTSAVRIMYVNGLKQLPQNIALVNGVNVSFLGHNLELGDVVEIIYTPGV